MSRLIPENPYTSAGWHSRQNQRARGGVMLDIAEVLKARENEFISLRELITRIRLQQPHVSESDIASFLYIENSNRELPEWVKQGIASTIEGTDGGYQDSELVTLLKVIHEEGHMPEVTPPSEPPMDFDDIPF
ncbi:hypothetical protein FIV60_09920 [Salmonella enterica]|uniref:Uncharacterized protein n=6 Tax=Salmonella enterica TaxID=28901 RepID=A0A401ANY0_SALSE|nr:hypothetical protein AH83_004270 [Salmonella enterica subsp. enterica serovar Tennessee]AUU27584.1 hypothetical protein MC62_017110 [Citrobacter freundii]EAA1034869.1 hypothetical protein [Salmonella enterica subsp. enterica serovar Senftenberg]EAA3360606.1 hypothetical protein [Salmonella enterica]EAA7481701.1 hypothetical protein [Salmonella enterica subsp. enterica serovar Irumu]EAO3023448.1 hypothetical protein [Salmonella enterica subsp. enterica serovar Worthington]EAW1156634.1 hypot